MVFLSAIRKVDYAKMKSIVDISDYYCRPTEMVFLSLIERAPLADRFGKERMVLPSENNHTCELWTNCCSLTTLNCQLKWLLKNVSFCFLSNTFDSDFTCALLLFQLFTIKFTAPFFQPDIGDWWTVVGFQMYCWANCSWPWVVFVDWWSGENHNWWKERRDPGHLCQQNVYQSWGGLEQLTT